MGYVHAINEPMEAIMRNFVTDLKVLATFPVIAFWVAVLWVKGYPLED